MEKLEDKDALNEDEQMGDKEDVTIEVVKSLRKNKREMKWREGRWGRLLSHSWGNYGFIAEATKLDAKMEDGFGQIIGCMSNSVFKVDNV